MRNWLENPVESPTEAQRRVSVLMEVLYAMEPGRVWGPKEIGEWCGCKAYSVEQATERALAKARQQVVRRNPRYLQRR